MIVQEMFDEIDKEEDGEVYYREVVDYLRSVNQDMDNELNHKVQEPGNGQRAQPQGTGTRTWTLDNELNLKVQEPGHGQRAQPQGTGNRTWTTSDNSLSISKSGRNLAYRVSYQVAYFSHPLLITSFPSYVQLQKQLQDYKAIGDQVLNFDEFVVSFSVWKKYFLYPQGESLLLGDLQ